MIKTVGATLAAPLLDHAVFGEAIGFVDSERGAEASGSRFAYIMREAVLLEFALGELRDGDGRAERVRAGHHARARARADDGRGRFLPDRSQPGVRAPRRRAFPARHERSRASALHREETLTSDQCRRDTAGTPRAFAAKRAPTARTRAGSSACTSSTSSRCSRSPRPTSRTTSTSSSSSIEEEILGGLVCRTASSTSRPVISARRPPRSTTSKCGCRRKGAYREATSCSNYRDYSARRLGARVKGEKGSQLLHTLNGTACAVSRTLVYLFEHYQTPDGGFTVPEVLAALHRFRFRPPRSMSASLPLRPEGCQSGRMGRS